MSGESPTPLGPDSLTWQRFGTWTGLLVSLWAGSMQNMHPQLGAAVSEHSRFFEERWNRLLRSTYVIGGVVFDGDRARETARQIRDYHRTIKGIDAQGRPYSALNPEVFFWAHTTFVMSIVLTSEHFGTPLSQAQKEQLWQEGLQWYQHYGLSMRSVPGTWAEFLDYYDRMCREVLEDNDATRAVLDLSTLPSPPRLQWLPAPVWSVVRVPMAALMLWLTVGMHDPAVRARLGYTWTERDQRRFRIVTKAVATMASLLPASWLTHPRKRRAQLREAGRLPADVAPAHAPDRLLPPQQWWSSGMHYLGAHEIGADRQD